MNFEKKFEAVFIILIILVIADSMHSVLFFYLSNAVDSAYKNGFSNVIPFLIVLFIVILIKPIVEVFDSLQE